MKRKEILEIEKRTEDNLYEMHFFYEDGWWRAYEMSAYLCNHLGNNLEETEKLKPTKKVLNNVGEYVFVGMKSSSFAKYLPDINIDSQECSHGVEVLGAFIKPYRTYISNQCLKRMSTKVRPFNDISSLTSSPLSSVNSYLGILNHYSSFNIRKDIFIKTLPLYKFGYFNDNITKFIELS